MHLPHHLLVKGGKSLEVECLGWKKLLELPWNIKFMLMLGKKIVIGNMFILEQHFMFLLKFSKVATIKLVWQ